MSIPMVSVIVPVYNSSRYLHRCIDSILYQSFNDFEVLLVDDGSTDNSGEICDEYAAKDSRVRVFHKENGGVSSARNVGLDNAVGEWVTFIDSDDWIDQDFGSIIKCLRDESVIVDIIISYPKSYTKCSLIMPDEQYEGLILSNDFQLLFSECRIDKYTYVWSKFYRKLFLDSENLHFDELISIGEDHVFLYSCLLKAKAVYSSPRKYYNYRYVEEGLSKRLYPIDTEFYGYNRLYTLISTMILQMKITDDAIQKQIKGALAHYLWRVLQALYVCHINRKKRMDILCSLDFSLLNYNHCNLLKRCLLRMLFSHKGLFFYDGLKNLQAKIKRY